MHQPTTDYIFNDNNNNHINLIIPNSQLKNSNNNNIEIISKSQSQ